MNYESIIQRLIESRKSAQLTQTQAGNLFGLSTAGLSDIENMRHRGLTVDRLLVMCEWYNVDPTWVLTGIAQHADAAAVTSHLQAIKAGAIALEALFNGEGE